MGFGLDLEQNPPVRLETRRSGSGRGSKAPGGVMRPARGRPVQAGVEAGVLRPEYGGRLDNSATFLLCT
jgi:hypothetical protein